MKTLVIGIGNPFRRDDGVGPAVIEALAGRCPAPVVLQSLPGEGTRLMDSWEGAAEVILIDAVCTPASPGTIYRFAAHRDPVPADLFPVSTHAFSLPQAIEMSRLFGTLPPQVIVYGIAAQDFQAGQGLSPAVAAAVPEVCRAILMEIANEKKEVPDA